MANKRELTGAKGDQRDVRRNRKGRIKRSDDHSGWFGQERRKGAKAETKSGRRDPVDHSLD